MLAEELIAFADEMELKLAGAKARETTRPAVVTPKQENGNPTGQPNTHRTLELVSNALSIAPEHRQLVHLIDVQRSVQGNLARLTEKNGQNDKNDDDEGGLKEEDKIDERKESLVLQTIRI